MRRSLISTSAALTVTAVALAGTGAASAASSTPAPAGEADGRVYIVQALPGDEVSVTVDGDDPTTGVATGEIVGPLELTPGSHEVSVQSEGDVDWMLRTSIQVASGRSVDVVLHRPAAPNGKPVVTVYRLPLAPVAADKGRLFVAHTATVPPADVRLDGALAFSNIANGEFVDAEVPAGEHTAAIVPTGGGDPALLGPLPVEIASRTLTSVYAIGRPQDNSMDVVVQELPLPQRGSAPPDEIETGSAGLVADMTVQGAVDHAADPTPAHDASTAMSWPLVGTLAGIALILMLTQGAVAERVRARGEHLDA